VTPTFTAWNRSSFDDTVGERNHFTGLNRSLPVGLREAQAAGIKFIHRLKIRFFAPQERLIAPIHVKLGMADGHLGSLGCAEFHLNRRKGGGGNAALKYEKLSLFGRVASQGLIF